MKKSFMKAALPTLTMLLVAIMSLTGVTYAWFTTSNTAEVAQFDVDVESADGLLISADNKTWKSKVSLADLKAGAGNLFPANSTGIAPLSTNGAVSSGTMPLYDASLTEDGDITVGSAKESGFVRFDLYVQNAGTSAKTVTITPTIENKTGGKSSVLAARLAYIVQGQEKITVAIGDNGSSATIYEPYAADHTEAGVNDFVSNGSSGVASNAVYPYLGISKADSETHKRYVADSVMQEVTTVTVASNLKFTIEAEKTAKLTFYFWIEGQDADCLNDVAGKALTLSLGFAAAPASN